MTDFLKQIEEYLNQPNLLFESWQVVIRIALTSIIMYILLIGILRMFGSRSVANFSIFDFIVTLTLGSTISSTLILSEVTLVNGLTALLLFLILQFIITQMAALWPKLNTWLNPSPKVVFFKGEFRDDSMKRGRIHQEEILSAIRRHAGTSSDQVYAVILETSGALSVITEVTEGYEEEITRYMDKIDSE